MRILVILCLFTLSSIVWAQEEGEGVCTQQDIASSQLVGGIDAEVISSAPIKLYERPSYDALLTAQLPTGTILNIGSGPQCREGQIWWQAKFDLKSTYETRTFGWLTEFEAAQSQLKPRIPRLSGLPQSPPITTTNVSSLRLSREMEPLAHVIDFVWSPDSQYLAISTLTAVWVYHIAINQPNLEPIRLPLVADFFWNDIGSVAFSSDSQSIATVNHETGDLQIWSLTGEAQKVVPVQVAGYMGTAAIAPDFSRWAIAHYDGSITVWDAHTGLNLQTLNGHSQVGALAFTPDGNYLVSMGSYAYTAPYDDGSGIDPTLRLWNLATGEAIAVHTLNMKQIRSRIYMHQDGTAATILMPIGEETNPEIIQMEIPGGVLKSQWSFEGNDYSGDLAFNSDGRLLAANLSTSIVFFQADDGSQLAQLPFDYGLMDIAFSPNDLWLAVAYEAQGEINRSVIQFWIANK